MGKRQAMMLVKTCAVLALIVACTCANPLSEDERISYNYAKMQANDKLVEEMFPDVLVQQTATADKAHCQFAKVPSWVSTEADLEEFLQDEHQKGTKITRSFHVRHKEEKKPAHKTKAPKKEVKHHHDLELVQLMKFPSWVETEEDMEAFFKKQKTKVTRRDSGNGDKNPSGRVFKIDHPPKTEEHMEPKTELIELPKSGSEPVPVHDRAERLKKLDARIEAEHASKLIEELTSI